MSVELTELEQALLSKLRNARNILAAEGYLYAKEIDKFLCERLKIEPPKRFQGADNGKEPHQL